MALKSVHKPENEFMAMSIKSLLEESGIHAMIHSYQIPWYNGLAKMMRSSWGEILVDEDDYDEALGIIEKFLEIQNNNQGIESTDPIE